jgi:Na+-driven multidrug efflux pump
MAGVFALQFVELSFLGHLSTQALASASIALIWLNVTSAFLWLGFGNALAAVVSQVCRCLLLEHG